MVHRSSPSPQSTILSSTKPDQKLNYKYKAKLELVGHRKSFGQFNILTINYKLKININPD